MFLSALLLFTAFNSFGVNTCKPAQDDLREHVRPHDQYNWLETRGVGDQRIIIKRHICVNLVKRVPLFRNLNERLIDDICLRLKPRLYTNNSYIIREGDRVDEMLFIIRGQLESATTNRFFINDFLRERDFCGDELLIWAFDAEFDANLPSSTRTLKALRDVEAFALPTDELNCCSLQGY
ncbi:hypothetical protein L1887_23872 [Cichorium endivia]|nr:hypothetical protein L1887_23872 [Cichorium endivia]